MVSLRATAAVLAVLTLSLTGGVLSAQCAPDIDPPTIIGTPADIVQTNDAGTAVPS